MKLSEIITLGIFAIILVAFIIYQHGLFVR
jgi:hypothetical protein